MSKEDFELFCEKFPDLSSILCFGRYLFTQRNKLTRAEITEWFDKLVDKNDYLRSEKQSLIDWLCENHGRSDEKKGSKKPL